MTETTAAQRKITIAELGDPGKRGQRRAENFDANEEQEHRAREIRRKEAEIIDLADDGICVPHGCDSA